MKCNCNGCNDEDTSKAMYSIDYDGLIEKLEETRDELDTVIKILKNRKEKDNMINTILSEEYEDDTQEDEIDVDELLKIIKDLKQKKTISPYKYHWYGDKDMFRYYPWFTF